MNVETILNSVYKIAQPIHIVEVGGLHTRAIAKWLREHPDAKFDSVDLDGRIQQAIHAELECDGTARFCTFRTQSPFRYLASQTWIDVAFLHPDTLDDGLDLFCLAASAGTQIIVIKDYQSRAAFAVQHATRLGWVFENDGEYCILRRPE